MSHRPISDKKQALLDEKNNSPLQVGEQVSVFGKCFYDSQAGKIVNCWIHSVVSDDEIYVYQGDDKPKPHLQKYKISKSDIFSRNLYNIGVDPFDRSAMDVRPVAFTLESIIFNIDILDKEDENDLYKIDNVTVREFNWNPYIYGKDGTKHYYQRDFVWSLEEKQLLIESIYQNIDCGKIIVRKRGFDELKTMYKNGERELFFKDIVDGKQRLNAMKGFLLCEYPDMHGNYYSDLSNKAQREVIDHQLFSYAEMPEDSKDASVIKQFLKLNFAGVPQSKEHIEYVKSLQKV